MRTQLAVTDEPVSFLFLDLPFHPHDTKRVIHPHRPESASIPRYNWISPPSEHPLMQYRRYTLTTVTHQRLGDVCRRRSPWRGAACWFIDSCRPIFTFTTRSLKSPYILRPVQIQYMSHILQLPDADKWKPAGSLLSDNIWIIKKKKNHKWNLTSLLPLKLQELSVP